MLHIISEKLLVLTWVRCGQRGAALSVVSFIGGDVRNHLRVSTGAYWYVIVLVVGSLLLKQLLFRKMGAKLRIHSSRGVAFVLILI